MAKYLIQGNYLGDGIGGLLKEDGTGRREAIEKSAASPGGKVDVLYYAFGDIDVLGIVDMPDHASVSAFALKASASGLVAVSTTVLMTPEEVDEAAKKSADYRAPGQ